jgi:hypothetical protein
MPHLVAIRLSVIPTAHLPSNSRKYTRDKLQSPFRGRVPEMSPNSSQASHDDSPQQAFSAAQTLYFLCHFFSMIDFRLAISVHQYHRRDEPRPTNNNINSMLVKRKSKIHTGKAFKPASISPIVQRRSSNPNWKGVNGVRGF